MNNMKTILNNIRNVVTDIKNNINDNISHSHNSSKAGTEQLC